MSERIKLVNVPQVSDWSEPQVVDMGGPPKLPESDRPSMLVSSIGGTYTARARYVAGDVPTLHDRLRDAAAVLRELWHYLRRGYLR